MNKELKESESGPIIIGISGKIGSGKSTTYKIIQYVYNNLRSGDQGSCHEVKFAFKLKQIVEVLTGEIMIDNDYSHDQKNKEAIGFNRTIGTMLQDVGSVFRDNVDKDVWVKAAFNSIHRIYNVGLGGIFVITDVRYENEADAIKKSGGYIIRLEGDPGKVRANSSRDLNHPSETSLDYANEYFDLIIDTDKTDITQLHNVIFDFIDGILKK